MVHDQALRAQRISDLSDDMVTVMSAFVNTEILKRDLDSKGELSERAAGTSTICPAPRGADCIYWGYERW